MATETMHRAYSDRRAFVMSNKGSRPADPLRAEILVSQREDGPTHIWVGVECTDAYLREAWEERNQFPGVTLDQLMAARDMRVQRSEVQRG